MQCLQHSTTFLHAHPELHPRVLFAAFDMILQALKHTRRKKTIVLCLLTMTKQPGSIAIDGHLELVKHALVSATPCLEALHSYRGVLSSQLVLRSWNLLLQAV